MCRDCSSRIPSTGEAEMDLVIFLVCVRDTYYSQLIVWSSLPFLFVMALARYFLINCPAQVHRLFLY